MSERLGSIAMVLDRETGDYEVTVDIGDQSHDLGTYCRDEAVQLMYRWPKDRGLALAADAHQRFLEFGQSGGHVVVIDVVRPLPATIDEIVTHFESLENLHGNWGTLLDNSKWNVNDETYINGVMMELDFDYRMAWLVQTVDRVSSDCRYVAVVFYHGRHDDGTYEKDYEAYDRGHKFFEAGPDFQEEVMHWAVTTILRLVAAHDAEMSRRFHEGYCVGEEVE